MNPIGFLPSSDVSFIVKNTSSINRSIKVFNTSIGPGNRLDLMKIPGVTEEDIRDELTKGYFKALLSGGALTIVSSTVNLSTSDPNHQSFLFSIGLSNSDNGGFEVFIYRDSEPNPKNNLFSTWINAYNAAFATNVPATIIIDNTLNSCSIPVNAGDFDLHQITLSGLSPTTISFLTINSGVTFNEGIGRVTNGLNITTTNDSTALATLTSADWTSLIIDNQASFTNGKSVPLFDFSNYTNNVILFVDTGASVSGNGSGAEFFTAGNSGISFDVYIGEKTTVDQYTFAGGSSPTINQTVNPLANSFVTSYPNFSGTFNLFYIGQSGLLNPFSSSEPLPTPGPTVPFNIQIGTMIYDTSNSTPYWWNGSSWNTFVIPPPPPPSPIIAASFFAIMPTDNPSPIDSGVPIAFPRDGPSTGGGFGQPSPPFRDFSTNPNTNFVLPNIGVYQVWFQVSITEPAQLVLTLDFAPLDDLFGSLNTVVGRDTGACQITGMSLIQTTTTNQIVQVGNVANVSNTPITITASAGANGSGKPVSANIIITQLQ
jgi:hypothetical protein